MTETATEHAELVGWHRDLIRLNAKANVRRSVRDDAEWREVYEVTKAALDAFRTPIAAHGAAVTEAMVDYVLRYGGRCRDCADEFGICPSSGLPCDVGKAKQAIHHTLEAIAYGTKHGYIEAALRPEEAAGQGEADEPWMVTHGLVDPEESAAQSWQKVEGGYLYKWLDADGVPHQYLSPTPLHPRATPRPAPVAPDIVERLGSVIDDILERYAVKGASVDELADYLQRIPEAIVAWGVERWRAEVANRPLVNVHRAGLDTAWRQVIRHFGGNPDALCGPDHYTLVEQNPVESAALRPDEAAGQGPQSLPQHERGDG